MQSGAAPDEVSNKDSLALAQLVRAFQVRGHLLAKVDPLGLAKARLPLDDLMPANYGFTDADMDREFDLTFAGQTASGFMGTAGKKQTLRKIYTRLQETYCGSIGYEYVLLGLKLCWIRAELV